MNTILIGFKTKNVGRHRLARDTEGHPSFELDNNNKVVYHCSLSEREARKRAERVLRTSENEDCISPGQS